MENKLLQPFITEAVRKHQQTAVDLCDDLYAHPEVSDQEFRSSQEIVDILRKADRMTMANSLELRVPFLDKEVFEVARRIPVRYRANARGTKLAMRGAAARSIPEKTADKKKLGFPVPVRAWLRDERYAAVVRKAFESEAAARFFKPKALQKLLADHLSGRRDNWRQIWCVFIFLVWYDEYFVKR